MKYILKEIEVPLFRVVAGSKPKEDVKIKILGCRERPNRELIRSNVEMAVYLSSLPDQLQELWRSFKNAVEEAGVPLFRVVAGTPKKDAEIKIEMATYLSSLPDQLQKLWRSFKNAVEEWIEEEQKS